MYKYQYLKTNCCYIKSYNVSTTTKIDANSLKFNNLSLYLKW